MSAAKKLQIRWLICETASVHAASLPRLAVSQIPTRRTFIKKSALRTLKLHSLLGMMTRKSSARTSVAL
jgi:hypothetical protein